MKRIRIFQENAEPVELVDNDESDLQTYTNSLTRLFEASHIVTLETDSQTFICRPSKINSILISTESMNQEELEPESIKFSDIPDQVPEEVVKETPEVVVKIEQDEESDFVTDGD